MAVEHVGGETPKFIVVEEDEDRSDTEPLVIHILNPHLVELGSIEILIEKDRLVAEVTPRHLPLRVRK